MTSARSRIALVTCRPQPGVPLDPDLPWLHRELLAAGAEAHAVCWDDPAIDWASYDLAVIRSTWDYTLHTEAYTAWADRCGALTRLANPAPVVRWNTDKRYLGDLAAAGVPVVPTRYLAPGDGEAPWPPEDPGTGGGHEYVIKPTAGAGARHAARYRAGDPEAAGAARRHLAQLHVRGVTAMVQPYMRGIDTTGERALLFFGGSLLHAIRKGAVLTPGTAHDAVKTAHPDARPWEPTRAELAAAERALAAVPDAPELLYARVDLVDGDDGRPCVMELELVEPNLFLHLHPGSVSTVVDGILKAAANGTG
ncbi:hypothetical protein [Streptomyces sp. TS71-3]|uniref:hypothetical protein n=1 Tax=Streptomyces sp. TS71-3 TaxID=2733862 RepID=UPI001B1C26AE|nr:hypothetical protein [Streptomyces sp. TS71-3]GHJ37832.1 ATP-grasp domain-containing protein [Streptomyces sp. TS71-3]